MSDILYLKRKKQTRHAFLFIGLLLLLFSMITDRGGEWHQVWERLPLLLTGSMHGWPLNGGFILNIFISIASMAIATVLGLFLGLLMLAKRRWLSIPARAVMNFLRNAPWLVLLFSMLYLLPYRVELLGFQFTLSPLFKAIVGLSLPTAANFAEVIRGAVNSVHSGQWESARSLGYSPWQIYRIVILPQALRRIIPGWMNLYALLAISTALATVTGVQEVVTLLRTTLATESEGSLVYFYVTVLLMFFCYCYPIALLARRLEFHTKGDAI